MSTKGSVMLEDAKYVEETENTCKDVEENTCTDAVENTYTDVEEITCTDIEENTCTEAYSVQNTIRGVVA